MIYLYLFLEFFKIGLFTIGGGYAMIPLVKETVLNHNWLSADQFYDFIGVCESTPGPIAINMATYVGTTQGGILGAIVASLGVVLPSFIIILLVAKFLYRFKDNKYIKYAISGINAVVIGLILATCISLVYNLIGFAGVNTTFEFHLEPLIILPILILIVVLYKKIFKKNMNAILVIAASIVLGIGVCLLTNVLM